MAQTKIEWADAVWNPVTGCTKVSPGCKHCYAERMARRLAGRHGYPADDPFRVTLHPEKLEEPRRWRKPLRIFVNSMSDLFHPSVPFDFINEVIYQMFVANQHIYLVLTKRPERALEYVRWRADRPDAPILSDRVLPPNLWLGVSVENQRYAEERIPTLLQIPAIVRWISAEPLLGPVCLTHIITEYLPMVDLDAMELGKADPALNALTGRWYDGQRSGQGPKLDWVVVGGESGPEARVCNPEWIRSVVRQCRSSGVPVFVKQLGTAWARETPGADYRGGDWDYWPEDLRVREWPAAR